MKKKAIIDLDAQGMQAVIEIQSYQTADDYTKPKEDRIMLEKWKATSVILHVQDYVDGYSTNNYRHVFLDPKSIDKIQSAIGDMLAALPESAIVTGSEDDEDLPF